MISAKEIHELRFEKAAFGYKQEDIDEFLTQLEQEVEIAEQEMADSNEKIQVLADKVREYMRDEDALKDALLGASSKLPKQTPRRMALLPMPRSVQMP